MSTQDKLNSAFALIDSYNQQAEKSDQIDKDNFHRCLKKLGGTSEELLAELKWEDIEKCGVPVLLARKIATIFRTESKVKEDPTYISEKKAQKLPPLSLIQAYNPQDPNNGVAKRLKELSHGKKFIVFKPGTQTVDVENSNRLLQEIMRGYPGRDSFDIDGRPVKTYAVGESLGEFVDENPLYPGRALRPDGTCDQTNRSWEGVPLTVRQLVYLGVSKTGEIHNNFKESHDTLDLALQPDAEKKLRQRYRKASTLLDEMEAAGEAPRLKVKLTANPTGRSNDPFYGGHRQY